MKVSERGAVYLVWNKTTKTRHIYREFIGSDEVYRKLQDVKCSYFPKIESVTEKDGHVVVLEEYIQGDTLAFILKDSPLAAEQVRKIAIHLCTALDSLHAFGVVHRDIKPENVILRGDEAVLIDFDASRLCKKERNMDTQAMGTAGYAAPEQYGFAQTDARADIYALGVLLNEMLIKQHPSKRLAEGVFLPIIEKCIEVNMDKRFASVKELLAALENAFTDIPKQKRLSPGKMAGIFATICVIVIGALCIFFYLRAGQERLDSPTGEHSNPSLSVSDAPQESIAEIPSGSIGIWTGTPVGRTTAFEYDLDGDGIPESYRFGVAFDNTLTGLNVLEDNQAVEVGGRTERAPMPCVWRLLPDGSEEVAVEFADLLADPEVTVWRTSETDAPAPEMQSLDALWPGGVMIHYTYEHLGTWIYEATATIDGNALRAVTVTILWDWDEFWAAH